jgi:hypothetical protein
MAVYAPMLKPGDSNEEDCAALRKALSDSEEDVKAGRLVDADVILRRRVASG